MNAVGMYELMLSRQLLPNQQSETIAQPRYLQYRFRGDRHGLLTGCTPPELSGRGLRHSIWLASLIRQCGLAY